MKILAIECFMLLEIWLFFFVITTILTFTNPNIQDYIYSFNTALLSQIVNSYKSIPCLNISSESPNVSNICDDHDINFILSFEEDSLTNPLINVIQGTSVNVKSWLESNDFLCKKRQVQYNIEIQRFVNSNNNNKIIFETVNTTSLNLNMTTRYLLQKYVSKYKFYRPSDIDIESLNTKKSIKLIIYIPANSHLVLIPSIDSINTTNTKNHSKLLSSFIDKTNLYGVIIFNYLNMNDSSKEEDEIIDFNNAYYQKYENIITSTMITHLQKLVNVSNTSITNNKKPRPKHERVLLSQAEYDIDSSFHNCRSIDNTALNNFIMLNQLFLSNRPIMVLDKYLYKILEKTLMLKTRISVLHNNYQIKTNYTVDEDILDRCNDSLINILNDYQLYSQNSLCTSSSSDNNNIDSADTNTYKECFNYNYDSNNLQTDNDNNNRFINNDNNNNSTTIEMTSKVRFHNFSYKISVFLLTVSSDMLTHPNLIHTSYIPAYQIITLLCPFWIPLLVPIVRIIQQWMRSCFYKRLNKISK